MMNSKSIMGPLGISLASILIVVVVIFFQASPIIAAMLHQGSSDEEDNSTVKSLLDASEEESSLYSDRFNGRSAFFTPPAPPPIQRQANSGPQITPEQRDMGPAKTYGGSLKNLNWIFGDTACFPSGSSITKVKIGETKNGVRLVSVHPPYYVKVAWTKPSTPTERYEEGIYDLYLFNLTDRGPNSPLPGTPPESGSRFEGIEVQPGTQSTPSVDPRQRLDPRRRTRDGRTYDDEDDDDGEDEEN